MRSSTRTHPSRAYDGAVSEVLGTVLLTAVTIILVSGFGITVFRSMSGEDVPAPTGFFSVDARAGLSYVNVTFREGTSFELTSATIGFAKGETVVPGGSIAAPLSSGRFSPGDVMRFDLPSGVVSVGDEYTFIAVDTDANTMIGYATASVPLASDLPAFASSLPTLSGVSFSPATIAADGTTTTTITVNVGSTYGLALIRTVAADLSDVGGGTLELRDDGEGADAIANDGVYSGEFSASSTALASGATTGTATIPVSVEDIFGHTATAGTGTLSLTQSDLTGLFEELLANATSATNILGVGGISRNVPSSEDVLTLNISNFTWRDITELENDVILYRITDMYDTSKAWAAAVYFSDCATGNPGGPYGAVEEVVFTRDGYTQRASWRPTSPVDCWTVDFDAVLELTNLNASVNATGASPSWTVMVTDSDGTMVAGDPSIYNYVNAGIGTINQGIVPYFGDTQPTANPHGALDDVGIGTATVDWDYQPNTAPTAVIGVTVTGLRTVAASGVGTSDAEGDAITYTWAWGDGSTSTGIAAAHTYSTAGEYEVTLFANDTGGNSGQASTTIGEAPTAAFNSTSLGLTVYASGTASTDPNGLALTHAWDWGDSTTSSGSTAMRTYASAGTSTVTLTVTNLFGSTGTSSASIQRTGELFLTCPAASTAVGTVSSCSALQSATDSGTSASLSEGSNSSRRQLYVAFGMVGFAETASTHTLTARAQQSTGSSEALSLQVRDATTGTWSTPTGFSWSSTTASTATHTLTAAQWNNGAPSFRFVDSACASSAYTCSSASDNNAATWAVDYVRVVTS